MSCILDNHGQPRHDRLMSRCCAYAMAGVWMLLFLSACSPDPADHQVRDAISAYFKAGDLQVVRLEIRTIEREPIGARQYMGPKRFIVHIPIITLQSIKQGGEPVDYQNVTITIRENKASLYGISIDNTSIIPFQ